MLTSSRRAIQYPNPTRADVPDIPAHFLNLVNALDLDTPFYTGTLAARPAFGSVVQGSWYWATDTSLLYFNNGAAWVSLAPTVSPALTGAPTAPTPAVTDNSTAIATTAFVRLVLPPGVMMAYVGAAAPTGWLLCDGTAVSRTGANAALFAIIGTAYGVGDGTTTFNLPDMRGRVPVGKNTATFNALGNVGGAETHSITQAEMPSHTHTFSGNAMGGHAHNFSGNTLPDHTHRMTQSEPDVIWDTNFQRSGSSTGVVSINGQSNRGSGFAFDSNTGAETPNLTPSGSIDSQSAGTPSGTNSSTGSGTAMSLIQPFQVVNYIIKV